MATPVGFHTRSTISDIITCEGSWKIHTKSSNILTYLSAADTLQSDNYRKVAIKNYNISLKIDSVFILSTAIYLSKCYKQVQYTVSIIQYYKTEIVLNATERRTKHRDISKNLDISKEHKEGSKEVL